MEPTIIIKYKNRKLYNKKTKKYITLEDMLKLSLTETVKIYEHKTYQDVTLKSMIVGLTNMIMKSDLETQEYFIRSYKVLVK